MDAPAAACLVWSANPTFLALGSFTIEWYGVLFGSALFAGFFLLRWQLLRGGLHEDQAFSLFALLFVGATVGAFLGERLFYETTAVLANPRLLVTLNGKIHGLSSHGAALGVLAALLLFRRKTGMGLLHLGDRVVMFAALVIAGVRLGNLMNSEMVGKVTSSLPWAFCYPRADGVAHGLIPRHPSQIYEALLALAILALLVLIDRRYGGEKRPTGMLSALFGLTYFGSRFMVEFYKEVPLVNTLLFGDLSTGQLLSIPFFIISFGIFYWVRGRRENGPSRNHR